MKITFSEIAIIIRFGLTGLTSLILFFGISYLFYLVIGNVLLSTVSAHVFVTIFNFLANNFFTFKKNNIKLIRIKKYLAINLSFLAINTISFYFLYDQLGLKNTYFFILVVASPLLTFIFFRNSVFSY